MVLLARVNIFLSYSHNPMYANCFIRLISNLFESGMRVDIMNFLGRTNFFQKILDKLAQLEARKMDLKKSGHDSLIIFIRKLMLALQSTLSTRRDLRDLLSSLHTLQTHSSFTALLGNLFTPLPPSPPPVDKHHQSRIHKK